ncbi:MAG: sporulation protein YabP [Oscillospiraceae bacterium]|nr:sporulation protein YabP [Oscillospiraceae bacterium]
MFEQSKPHSIIVENRRKTVITGVKDVESFNENDIIIITHSGGLKIRGKNLEISKISVETGDLEMTGEVTSLHYSDHDRSPNNIITKLFR